MARGMQIAITGMELAGDRVVLQLRVRGALRLELVPEMSGPARTLGEEEDDGWDGLDRECEARCAAGPRRDAAPVSHEKDNDGGRVIGGAFPKGTKAERLELAQEVVGSLRSADRGVGLGHSMLADLFAMDSGELFLRVCVLELRRYITDQEAMLERLRGALRATEAALAGERESSGGRDA